ncbi:unnamed protein product [Rangifer tarandus platyrhynchus]|uniref:Uncharacterized protein n=1 Tax=Rangifer tarandus platyrhynchus TaxID=3082113 RepID=A0AC59ZV19_RANTA
MPALCRVYSCLQALALRFMCGCGLTCADDAAGLRPGKSRNTRAPTRVGRGKTDELPQSSVSRALALNSDSSAPATSSLSPTPSSNPLTRPSNNFCSVSSTEQMKGASASS